LSECQRNPLSALCFAFFGNVWGCWTLVVPASLQKMYTILFYYIIFVLACWLVLKWLCFNTDVPVLVELVML
jgi:hypothetical protein